MEVLVIQGPWCHVANDHCSLWGLSSPWCHSPHHFLCTFSREYDTCQALEGIYAPNPGLSQLSGARTPPPPDPISHPHGVPPKAWAGTIWLTGIPASQILVPPSSREEEAWCSPVLLSRPEDQSKACSFRGAFARWGKM